ncbi:ankyrin repeat-containing protein ITN1-like isoform X2 [Papaver somniferum]|uniref:ankyrin repeat-containing protein ITN1-like isoform X2 n=1 Tax=Papaver somniferum TaxID=3469 RepID=UPI000E6FE344|nr:ankyrin repeat-containing protein ITN1-like isoform X2 [Papaver somniferum]
MGTRGSVATEGPRAKEICISVRQRSFNYAYCYKATEYGRDLKQYLTLLDAAMSNNWESAAQFIKNDPSSVNVAITVCGRTALHIAAGAGHSKFILKLVDHMSMEALELKDSYDGNSGAQLICNITRAGLYELATNLIHEHPSLATAQLDNGTTALDVIPEKDLSIPTAYEESTLSLLAYHQHCTITDKPASIFLKMLFCFGSKSKGFHRRKLKSYIVLELVNLVFEEITLMPREEMFQFFLGSNFLKTAAKNGSVGIIKMCIATYPDQLWLPREGRNIFQIAVENRQEKIFNYSYEHMNADEKILTTHIVESNGGNILHVAAKIAPPSRLNIYTSPVVQMQSEIIWFKKVEKRVPRALRNMRNKDGETPREVFTREHKHLVKTAEAYMIRTAESCLVVASLVATVAFAAAITLPGGTFSDSNATDEKGKPIFLGKKKFLAFMVADALALFSSTTTILLFLSIFIGNHNEGNFKEILPRRLKRGLGSLILSVLSVVIAFSIALYIILGDRYKWAPYLIVVAACYSLLISLKSLYILFVELDDIKGPVLYWAIPKDHKPNVRIVLKNV